MSPDFNGVNINFLIPCDQTQFIVYLKTSLSKMIPFVEGKDMEAIRVYVEESAADARQFRERAQHR